MFQVQLASRLNGVSESATLKLNAAVQAMKAQGIDVANLTAGEPDFNVPDAAKEAVVESLKLNRSRYTPVPGVIELRNQIVEKTNSQQPELPARWKATNVIVTNGGKQALYNTFMALLNPGDEVLIPAPYWLSYPEMVKLAGGTPRFIESKFENDYKITPDQLRSAITPKTKLIVFNSPSNPTGAMYSKAEYQALGKVLLEDANAKNVMVISDEIYDRITFDPEPFCSFLGACPALQERTITVNGMSKSAAMTGWRIGWSVASEAISQALNTLQGQSTSGINALAQWASIASLKLPESTFASQVQSFRERRDLTLEILKKAGKIDIVKPAGAFYLFLGVGSYLRSGEDSFAFAEELLEKAQVAVVPGTPFGAPQSVRISYATDQATLIKGCEKIVEFVKQRA